MSDLNNGLVNKLKTSFPEAQRSPDVRFLKITVRLNSDRVEELQDLTVSNLEELQLDDVPAFILAKIDDSPPGSEWLPIEYVPQDASVRNKMVFSLNLRGLTDFLTSFPLKPLRIDLKQDLTSAALSKHVKNEPVANPLSKEEKMRAEAHAGERKERAERGTAGRALGGMTIGLEWGAEVEDALRKLGESSGEGLVVATINDGTLALHSSTPGPAPLEIGVNELGSSLPATDICFAFFAYNAQPQRHIVFIYSQPPEQSSSTQSAFEKARTRMPYSSGKLGVYDAAQKILPASSADGIVWSKIDNFDPVEDLTETHLREQLGLGQGDARAAAGTGAGTGNTIGGESGTGTPTMRTEQKFSRPVRPGRKTAK